MTTDKDLASCLECIRMARSKKASPALKATLPKLLALKKLILKRLKMQGEVNTLEAKIAAITMRLN